MLFFHKEIAISIIRFTLCCNDSQFRDNNGRIIQKEFDWGCVPQEGEFVVLGKEPLTVLLEIKRGDVVHHVHEGVVEIKQTLGNGVYFAQLFSNSEGWKEIAR